MKNKLTDLNNHLFMALERLNDEDLTSEQLEQETMRAKAMVDVSTQITTISAQQLKAEYQRGIDAAQMRLDHALAELERI